MCPGPHQNYGRCWRHKTGLSSPVKYFTDRFKAVLLMWIFFFFFFFIIFCLVFDMPLCAPVHLYLLVTCWERADPLTPVSGV